MVHMRRSEVNFWYQSSSLTLLETRVSLFIAACGGLTGLPESTDSSAFAFHLPLGDHRGFCDCTWVMHEF